jgi:hypothetical protein
VSQALSHADQPIPRGDKESSFCCGHAVEYLIGVDITVFLTESMRPGQGLI